MDTLTIVVLTLLGAGLLAVAMTVSPMFRSFRRIVTVESPHPLGRMMAGWGLSPDDAAGREHDLAVAASRCGGCGTAEQCREWLASRQRKGAVAFCPNARFFGELKAATKRANG